MSGPEGKPRVPFAPNAEVYDASYYRAMYRPHWFLRNRRKYRERDAAMLRIVRPAPGIRILELGSARGDSAFSSSLRSSRRSWASMRQKRLSSSRVRKRGAGRSPTRDSNRRMPGSRSFPARASTLSCWRISSSTWKTTFSCPRSRNPAGCSEREVLSRSTPRTSITGPNGSRRPCPGLQQSDHIAVRPAARGRPSLVASCRLPAVDELSFSASPYPLLGGYRPPLLRGPRLCRFRTVLRAPPAGLTPASRRRRPAGGPGLDVRHPEGTLRSLAAAARKDDHDDAPDLPSHSSRRRAPRGRSPCPPSLPE